MVNFYKRRDCLEKNIFLFKTFLINKLFKINFKSLSKLRSEMTYFQMRTLNQIHLKSNLDRVFVIYSCFISVNNIDIEKYSIKTNK